MKAFQHKQQKKEALKLSQHKKRCPKVYLNIKKENLKLSHPKKGSLEGYLNIKKKSLESICSQGSLEKRRLPTLPHCIAVPSA